MARPEKPITWDGPVADLARALRTVRERAGSPPYRAMGQLVHRSVSVLADAAAGHRCPTWQVASAYVQACGGSEDDQRLIHAHWELARAADAQTREASNRDRTQHPDTDVGYARPAQAGPERRPAGPPSPNPWEAKTPQQFRYQLRALRAWAGNLSAWEITKRGGADIPASTLYDALSPNLERLPSLRIVRAIVRACEADVSQWEGAWREIEMKAFHLANPRPADLGKI
ncbi:hypothetical protein ACIHFD_57440 [Nonomuraea sp. NPDC051941]|uniref:hypothetical protein n=1 Tax=Nonomuraea sp. NPDC051941 TaxID=3364373 RepID=UPI0037C9887C